jgi:ankyrin repeat protein
MLASYHGHLPLVRLLLSHGANPNILNDRQQSPLAGAIFKGEKEVVEALADAGADWDVGEPSAREAVKIFRQEEVWGDRMGVKMVNGDEGHGR